jgi:protein transport protein SEC23
MNVEQIEDKDGVRFSWNVFPPTKAESSKLVVPVAALYTPLKTRAEGELPTVAYEPVVCRCRAIINPYCQLDIQSKFWICPFCLQRNPFPPQYRDLVGPQNLPAEVHEACTTIEYILPRTAAAPPVFFFVVDTCLEEGEDLQALKEALAVSLSLLPPKALVGVITFGTMVQVHEVGFTEMPKSYVFRGSKEYTTPQIQDMLGLGVTGSATGHSLPAASPAASQQHMPAQTQPQTQPQTQTQTQQPAHSMSRSLSGPLTPSVLRFLVPVEQGESAIANLFEQLSRDPWPVEADKRPQRATGAAINIALSLLESCVPQSGARVLVFSGGPCTVGPGMIVGRELKEALRAHKDLVCDTAKYYRKAASFYEQLGKKAAGRGHIVDILVGCLDQVGVAEMSSLANMTGGNIVLSDSFATNIFKQSVQRVFLTDSQGALQMAFNAVFEVLLGCDMRVCGMIGPAVGMAKKTPMVSEVEIGLAGTTAWKLCGLTPRTTLALYFEMAGQPGPVNPGHRGLLQFITHYQHSSGSTRLRVTTCARPIMDPQASPHVASSFDQEAAAVLMARIAAFKAEREESGDVLRWLDRLLIRICQRFGEYRKDDPSSFRLAPLFSLYPQLMFHLRRSQFLSTFNSSPDETAFFRHILNRESTLNSLLMIQPTLTAYALEGPPQPVLLDSVSIRPDTILLLDAFFQIVIFHGAHIAQWRNDNYHLQPEYAAFKALLEAPVADAAELLADRYPIPLYIVCDQGGSQARFLLSKLNPSTTHTTNYASQLGHDPSAPAAAIFTDDVSLQVFFEHLKKLVVTQTAQ